MTETNSPFTAIILAGKRPGKDPVAEAAGVTCKSFAPIGGRPMVYRVLEALAAARQVGPRILCGLSESIIAQTPELKTLIDTGKVQHIAGHSTPSASTYHALQSVSNGSPILVTTADHALLTAQIVDFFCNEVRQLGCDVAAGLTPYDGVISAFPGTRRTAIKFNDGAYSGCNLFGFLNPRSHRAAEFWRQIEQERKKPLRMIRILGWWALIRYVTGRLSLHDALAYLSRRIGIRAGVVILPFPEAAVDVDSVDDWYFVQTLVKKQGY
ncbi:MAG: nucleotidyltransferase family protein [Desulfobacterales bacterium]|jgi:GTP:adenosylcobinamide-phosphate guanylyltransferase|nr:nucleotidyltransferase family protein [Deltaproteobacteria bacterium]